MFLLSGTEGNPRPCGRMDDKLGAVMSHITRHYEISTATYIRVHFNPTQQLNRGANEIFIKQRGRDHE